MTPQIQSQPQRRPRQAWTEVTVRMSPDLANTIKAIAQRDARSIAGLMRKLAMQHVEQERERQQVTAA